MFCMLLNLGKKKLSVYKIPFFAVNATPSTFAVHYFARMNFANPEP